MNLDNELHEAKHRSDEREIARLNRCMQNALVDLNMIANEIEMYRGALVTIKSALAFNKLDRATRTEMIAMVDYTLGDDDDMRAAS